MLRASVSSQQLFRLRLPTDCPEQVRRGKPSPITKSIAIQTEEQDDNPLLDEIAELESHFSQLKHEHETTLAYTRELGQENQRLRKQAALFMKESEKLQASTEEMQGTIRELKKKNDDLIDENGWIVVAKAEQEEKTKQLQLENENLTRQYEIVSNQRRELEASQRFLLFPSFLPRLSFSILRISSHKADFTLGIGPNNS